MPAVYQVLRDARFKRLEPVDKKLFLKAADDSWAFDGRRVGESWQPLEMFAREAMLETPNVWQVSHTYAFDKVAVALVQMCLDQAGEQLPLPYESRDLVVLNVTNVIDCLDRKNCEYNDNLPNLINKYAFHADRLDYSLFKIPEMRKTALYTVEGLARR